MRWDNLKMQGMEFLPRFGASSVIFKDTLFVMGGCYNNESQVLTYKFGKFYSFSPCPEVFRGEFVE